MKKSRNKKHHIVFILFFIITAIFFYYEEFGKDKKQKIAPSLTKPGKKAEVDLHKVKPKIAIVIDDLGVNREAAGTILKIKAPVTLSILPQQPYSTWIAEEGHKLGHNIIAHIPMEAEKSYKLGEGGLYIWMTDGEIADTLNKDLRSIPHAIGVSNHMGSAFTQDERAMKVLISELKKRNLFFLDSLTSSRSVGSHLAKTQGVKTINRDIFLDDVDNPAEIEKQWRKLASIAEKNGHAVLLAHPRKNSIEFLQKTLKSNNEIIIVPLSGLMH